MMLSMSAGGFCPGTRIATPLGEVAVEAVAIGDVLPTLHGGLRRVKWIGTHSHATPFTQDEAVLPVLIRAGAIADGVPARDLFVSPGHALCIDAVLIQAGLLVNGVTIIQASEAALVEYVHIEMESHEVIFAENCPAESFWDEDLRPLFHNAAAFDELYPGPAVPQSPCLAQLSHGFALAVIQQRLRLRAGIMPNPRRGGLRGYIDEVGPEICTGWAQDMVVPDEPVCLDILLDGQRVGRVLANVFREDVRADGHGRGYHGFEFLLPEGEEGAVTVCRASDGAMLEWVGADEAA